VLEGGGRISQETLLWNQSANRTDSMRSKEKAHDYRYFPEPDLLPVHVSSAWREEIRRALPELPEAKRARFKSQYQITDYDVQALTAPLGLAEYFEAVVADGAPSQLAANWILTEVLRYHVAKETLRVVQGTPTKFLDLVEKTSDVHGGNYVEPKALAELLKMVAIGELSAANGKRVLARMVETGRRAAEIVAAEGLAQISDTSAIEQAAREVIAKNPDNVAKYKSGNEGVFKFFVGQVMRATRGQANPQAVNDILRQLLS